MSEYLREAVDLVCDCIKQNIRAFGGRRAVNSPAVIDVCVPHSEVIDGSIVGRGVQSRSFYCVSESRGELEQEGGVALRRA